MSNAWIKVCEKKPIDGQRCMVSIYGFGCPTPYIADFIDTKSGGRFVPVYDDIIAEHPMSGSMYSISMAEFDIQPSHWMPIFDFLALDPEHEPVSNSYKMTITELARIRTEARAEALKEAAERALEVCHEYQKGVAYVDLVTLRAAILADEPKEERGAEGPWHTEPPSKDGLYLVEVNAKFSSPSPWYETAFYRQRDGWSLPEPSKGSEVLAWMEIPRRAEVERRIEASRS